MSRFDRYCVVLTSLLVTVTGLGFAWFRYAAEVTDPFALQHPALAQWQHSHVWVAPLFVFAVGLIWKQHIWRHLVAKVRARRRTGVTMLVWLAPMVLSGYLLQTSVGESVQQFWIVTHLGSSTVWCIALGVHLLPMLQRIRRHNG